MQTEKDFIMCTITLNINERQIREVNPSLTDIDAITRWAQHLLDTCIADLTADRHSHKELKPYTIEELHARIAKAERDSAEGRYRSHDEVFAKYHQEFFEAV